MTLAKFIREFQISDSVVKMMYNCVIHPAMVFGLKASALTKANRNKIRRYENYIVRTMRLHSKKASTARTINEYLDGKTAMRRIRVLRASYFGHISRRPHNHLLQHAYHYRAFPRKVGRPCITWLDNVAQDRTKYNFHNIEWETAAGDKNVIKRMAETIYEECQNPSSEEENLSDDEENHSRFL